MTQTLVRNLANKALAGKVRKRKRFLDETIDPVIKLVCERGRMVSRNQGSSNTHVVWELRNFGGFSFHTDLGQTMFGGNTVKIYYHPGRSFREGGLDSAHDKEWIPVLEVDFQTHREYVVKRFDETTGWRRALVRVLRNKDKIASRTAKTSQKQVKRSHAAELR